MHKDDGIFQSQIRWLLEEPLSNIVVVAASDEAIWNEFELDGTVFALGGQSLEFGYEIEDILA